MAAMAALAVRSGSVRFAWRRGVDLLKPVRRTHAIERDRLPVLAMQKVVGSSPIIRSLKPCKSRGTIALLGNDGSSVAALVPEVELDAWR
jgi:hypothetical protein